MTTTSLNGHKRHPLSAIFMDPPDSEFKATVDDIKANGLIEPIVTIGESEILDGWTRYRACMEAGVEPHFVRFEDIGKDQTPMMFVMSRNFYRKHLTATQRACIACEMFEGRWLKRGQHGNAQSPQNSVTNAEVAKLARVSKDTMNKVRVIKRAAPEIFAKMKSGDLKDPARVYEANPQLRKPINPATNPSLTASRALTPMLIGVRDLVEGLKLKPKEFAKNWAIWEGADKAQRLKAMKQAHQWLGETIAAVEAQEAIKTASDH